MTETLLKITFQPQGRTVFVLRGTTIQEAAARCGLVIGTPCGGAGTCGKCRVRLRHGAATPTAADRACFSPSHLQDGWRLACQNRLESDCVVTVPAESLLGAETQILATAAAGTPPEIHPAIRKVYVELARPTLEDDTPDLLRLEKAVGPFKADLALVRHVATTLRHHDFKGTAVLADHRLVDFEPGNTSDCCFGAAFDIGTTTMVGTLLSLHDGRELAVTSRVNPQVSFGDDVLSRIKYAGTCSKCLDDMRMAVVREVTEMVGELSAAAGINREAIYEVAFAGNTTMEHILCGINPAQLGELPFAPAHARGLLVPATDLGLAIHHGALAYMFPIIGGFVGGDTVAGMLATQIAQLPGPVLLVDIGTNGEIVLAHNGSFYAASTAAGPAFEGARIACGMRGTYGAIEKVVFAGDVRLEVIGNAAPSGLCGSGLIDLLAELLNHGMVSADGQLLCAEELPRDLPQALASRVQVGEDGTPRFQLAGAIPGRGEPPVFLTQRDVREVQLGSGAIRAGIAMLLQKAGLAAGDLQSVLIAGGFGNFIRRSSAQRIGLLPTGIDHQRIRYVGNVSLAGARVALLSTEARRHGEELARQTQHVELSISGDFQAAFAEAMLFPPPQ